VTTRYAFLDHDGPIAFAHRGGASEAPENTMPAFQYAVDLGYQYIETDVHATSDGVLLAFHDSKLDRVTNMTGVIREMPYSEVSKALVDGREPIPRFEELLLAWPELRINIDPKKDNAIAPLIASLKQHGAVDRVCIGAFSDSRLDTMRRELGPKLCTSAGPLETARLVAAAHGLPLPVPPGVACAQVPVKQGPLPIVNARFVSFMHSHEMQVHVWTIDNEPEMDRLFDLGVDGIMTDRPALLKTVMQRRGTWN
jgi:glycerophosphoryl diester phosphodiesterase